MSGMDTPPAHDDAPVGNRWPELAVSAFLMIIALAVIADSVRVGTGWGEDGPRSGYFPFYIGCALLLSSGAVLVGQLLRWRGDKSMFAERGQLKLVVSVLVPMVVYVVGVFAIGIYFASAALIAYFMLRHGKYRWMPTAAVSIGVPVFFLLVFEKWFLVPLPKGPIERLLGM